MHEVHDCFSITEFVTMEDLHISPEGGALKDVRMASTTPTGSSLLIDGGSNVSAPDRWSGLRMIYEIYLQILWRAGSDS